MRTSLPPAPPLLAAQSPAPLRLGSSLRCRTPAETLTIAQPLMASLGITRVTDVTRLDRLGLPVYASIRPRGLALCVNAGKGIHPLEARVGALMEAVEFAAAEPMRSTWDRRTMRLGELADEWRGELRLLHLAPRIGPSPRPERLIDAIECDDIAGGRPMWLPAELVFVPYPDPHGPVLCGWGTNGLASGNSVAEATLHGLLEVLERDAVGMAKALDLSLWMETDDLPEPFCTLAAHWRALGVELSLRFVPNDFGLPCFHAVLYEGQGAVIGLAEGSGLHLDPAIALARAVCEAAQSRVSHIHGGRDDVTMFYETHGDGRANVTPTHETSAYRVAFDTRRRIAWREVPSMPVGAEPLEQVLARVVQCLRGLGFGRVFRHRFALDLGGMHVVKIVVPRCEPSEHGLHRIGERLLERIGIDA